MIALCALLLAGGNTFAGTGNWVKINGAIPSVHEQAVFPNAYSAFQMDEPAIRAILAKSTLSPEHPVVLSLPDASGIIRNFDVWETPVLAPELQAQYPNIRTYTAVCKDNDAVTAKITMGNMGMNAVVFDIENTYFINPYSRTNDGYYLIYNKKDFTRGAFANGACGVGVEAQKLTDGLIATIRKNETVDTKPSHTAYRTHGEIRKRYRTAIACTGEWAQSMMAMPNTQGILEIIASIVNGGNGVFERELSVTMVLIPQETQVIYLDPTTDPYQNDGNNDALIGENQTNFDNVFTGTEYDIGHIFNTAGGGLAQLQSICSGGSASGVSGATSPTDYFVMIHEMGHQMGSGHVFNSEAGGCSGNSSATSAYEPGSGTSIMCYNGVCAADNVGPAATDYYHTYSLDAMTTLISALNCGTDSLGTNPAIQIPQISGTYYIPRYTPFELEAPVATPTEATPVVTYCWEQWDLGHNGDPEGQSATWQSGPIMQSFDPTTNRLRTFPRLNHIMNNTYDTVGQRLPKKDREMNFRLTARSYKAGWGTINTNPNEGKIKIVVADKDSFRVTDPDDGSLWNVGSTVSINWVAGGTTESPISCNFVNIYMSTDGGNTFPFLIAMNTANDGQYDYVVQDLYSDSVIIKVKGANNVFFDISKKYNQIHGNPNKLPDLSNNDMLSIMPNPASSVITLYSKLNKKNGLDVALYNVAGQRVYSDKMYQNLEINVSTLARGTYFVHVIDPASGEKHVSKVVLQ